jgi:hypothetical protein
MTACFSDRSCFDAPLIAFHCISLPCPRSSLFIIPAMTLPIWSGIIISFLSPSYHSIIEINSELMLLQIAGNPKLQCILVTIVNCLCQIICLLKTVYIHQLDQTGKHTKVGFLSTADTNGLMNSDHSHHQ